MGIHVGWLQRPDVFMRNEEYTFFGFHNAVESAHTQAAHGTLVWSESKGVL